MTDRVPTIYVYDQDRTSPFGKKIEPLTTASLPRNQWHSISLYVRLNSGANASDGLIELYVNGTKRAEYKNVRLRGVTTDDTRANTLLFHTFFGGTDTGEPIGTAHARFDEIYVREGKTIR